MKLSDKIEHIYKNQTEEITFRDFLERLDEQSFGVLFVILALPSALPIPIPGSAAPFGIILLSLGIQFLMNRHTPWFPEKMLNRKLQTGTNARFLTWMTRFIRFCERFTVSRGVGLFKKRGFHWVLGGMIVLCATSMMSPIPGMNSLPSFGIFLIGLSLIEEDALVAFLGILACIAGLVMSGFVLYFVIHFGLQGATMAKDQVKAWLGL